MEAGVLGLSSGPAEQGAGTDVKDIAQESEVLGRQVIPTGFVHKVPSAQFSLASEFSKV